MMLYDLITGSWALGDAKIGGSTYNYSNFESDWNNDLIVYRVSLGTSDIYKWDNTPDATQTVTIETGDKDLKIPDVKKNFYTFKITYKGGTSQSMTIKYKADGTGSWTDWNGASALLTDTTGNQVVLDQDASSIVSNKKSIAFQLTGTAATGFEVNDMEIIFRKEGIR